jgi:hypothetical protein
MMCAGLLFAGLPAARPHQPTPPATAVVLLDGSVAPHVTAHVLEAVISGLQGDAAYGKPGLTVYVRAVTDHALGVDAALVTLHIPPVGAAPHLRSCSLFDAVCKTQQAALLRTAQADLHRAQEAVAAAARMLRHLRVPRAQRPDLVGATWAAYGLLAMPRPGMRYLVVSSALPVPPVASGPPLFTGIDIDMIYSCDADVATCLRRHLTRLQWALQLSCGAVDHVVEGHGGQAQGAGAHGLHQPAVLAGLLLGLAQRLFVYGGDDQVLQALVDGQVRVLDPHRLPPELTSNG